jgi:hypothetical protein
MIQRTYFTLVRDKFLIQSLELLIERFKKKKKLHGEIYANVQKLEGLAVVSNLKIMGV